MKLGTENTYVSLAFVFVICAVTWSISAMNSDVQALKVATAEIKSDVKTLLSRKGEEVAGPLKACGLNNPGPYSMVEHGR